MFRRLLVCILIAVAATPLMAPAASKEYQELQRDIAQLQDMVKALQKAQDQMLQTQNEKFAALQTLVQQSLNAANSADKAAAVIQSSVQQTLRDQGDKVLGPVATLSTRMDEMSRDLTGVQQAVTDLTGTVNGIKTMLGDISTALKAMQAPAAPPPASPGGGDASPAAAVAAGPPPLSAADMLTAGRADYGAGNLDLALKDYSDFLKYYGNTADAPEALFYIGYIHWLQAGREKDKAAQQQLFKQAASDFDAVVERSPSSNKRVPQAILFKGRSLLRLDRRNDAAAEFKDLVTQFPDDKTNVAAACDELQKLGVNCKSPSKAAPKAPGKTTTRKK